MRGWGILLVIAGIALVLISLVVPVSVDGASYGESILNVGRLQTQMMVFQAGLASFLAGAVFTAAGEILEHLRGNSVPVGSGEAATAAQIFDDRAVTSAREPGALALAEAAAADDAAFGKRITAVIAIVLLVLVVSGASFM